MQNDQSKNGQPVSVGSTGGSALLCGHTTGIDCGSGQRAFKDFITFDEDTAKAHVAKYKGSWTDEGWYVRLPILPNNPDEQ